MGFTVCRVDDPRIQGRLAMNLASVKKLWRSFAEVALEAPASFPDLLCHRKGAHRIVEVKTGKASLRRGKREKRLIARLEGSRISS
jgi:hypothetical protein